MQCKQVLETEASSLAGTATHLPCHYHTLLPLDSQPRPQLLLDTVAIPGYEVEADLGRGHLHKVMQTALLVRSSGQVAATMTLKKGTSWGSKQEDTNLQQIGVRLRCRSRSTQTRVAL